MCCAVTSFTSRDIVYVLVVEICKQMGEIVQSTHSLNLLARVAIDKRATLEQRLSRLRVILNKGNLIDLVCGSLLLIAFA